MSILIYRGFKIYGVWMSIYSLACDRAFSLIELMVVIAIVAILSYMSVSSYRANVVSSTISALIPLSARVKIEVEHAHNQGVIFGTGAIQSYLSSSDPNLPKGLAYMRRVNYGCVDIGIDLAALSLDATNTLIMTWCPKNVDDSSIEWSCSYGSTSTLEYVHLLPDNCQNPDVSIQNSSF